jgi:uncharacterized protein
MKYIWFCIQPKKINMYKTLLATLSVFLLLSCNDAQKSSATIKVSGEGKIRIKPDLINLTININFVQPRMVDAVRLSQETADSVVAILKQFAQQNDIKTSNISANKEYNYVNGRNVFAGYQAEQNIDFILRDISRFTDLTAKLLATRINGISQVEFGHSKADSLLREADLLAYDDALKSAHKLCERANVKLGSLVYLTNTGEVETGAPVYSNMGNINTFNKSYGGEGFKVSPEILVFSRKVISEYRISDQ